MNTRVAIVINPVNIRVVGCRFKDFCIIIFPFLESDNLFCAKPSNPEQKSETWEKEEGRKNNYNCPLVAGIIGFGFL